MAERLTILFDSRIFLSVNACLGFLFLGFFVFFYFSKEGKDERGRGLIATASLIAFAVLFVLLNNLRIFIRVFYGSHNPVSKWNIIIS